jgi:hypothetical protein
MTIKVTDPSDLLKDEGEKVKFTSKEKKKRLTRKQIETEIEELANKGLSPCASSRYWRTDNK